MLLLLNHPEKMEVLLAEINAAFPSRGDSITYAKTQELPYLNAVLNESMRVMPIVVAGKCRPLLETTYEINCIGLARLVTETTLLCNLEIPAGVS